MTALGVHSSFWIILFRFAAGSSKLFSWRESATQLLPILWDCGLNAGNQWCSAILKQKDMPRTLVFANENGESWPSKDQMQCMIETSSGSGESQLFFPKLGRESAKNSYFIHGKPPCLDHFPWEAPRFPYICIPTNIYIYTYIYTYHRCPQDRTRKTFRWMLHHGSFRHQFAHGIHGIQRWKIPRSWPYRSFPAVTPAELLP